MRFEYPRDQDQAALRRLWKQAFGDGDDFLDAFFSTGFSADRCRCAWVDGTLAGALYWLDCQLEGRKIAYLYAVATDMDHQGRGMCHRMMEDTHALLAAQGYSGAILVPGEDSLWRFYGRMGYEPCTKIRTVDCDAGGQPVALGRIGMEDYARLRRQRLPAGGLLQEGPSLAFLATQAAFYEGEGLLLAARREGERLFALELLGDPSAAPRILTTLGAARGCFRCGGDGEWFSMYRSFDGMEMPDYLGFSFD